MTDSRIVIIGGGLAGMAAAVALESTGCAVTLIEARRVLGGRAGSFQDPKTDEVLDNCQHVLLGCCTNLIDFYSRIGAAGHIRFEPTIRFADATGRQWGLSGTAHLPAPLHLGPAFARFGLLSLGQRLEIARAMTAILRITPAEMRRLADVPFGDWLDAHGQSPETIRNLYDPVIISGLNEKTRLTAASWAIKVFRDSLLVNSRGYLFGLPTCPLGKLYERLPVKDLRLGTRLTELCFNNRKITAIKTQDGQTIPCDAVVMATNHHALNNWIPADLWTADTRFAGLDKLVSVPILGAHMWFDRPIMDVSHLALVDGPLQWLFRKDADGRAVHGVISAARDWLTLSRDECLKQFEGQIRTTLPRAAEAKLERSVIVIEKRATFSPLPGSDKFRPPQAPIPGGIENLYLAGDYTQTGWPATMEGAVRSGYLAASALLRGVAGKHQDFVVADLPREWPARWMGRG